MNRSLLPLFLLPVLLWTGLAQADGVSPRQVAACRDAVRNLQDFPNLDYESVTMSPDRIDRHGRAVVEWRVETRRTRANGHCRVERDGQVTEVKIKEISRESSRDNLEPPAGISMERDVARRGKPYYDFQARGPRECARACLDDDRCLAYNYRVEERSCGLKDGYYDIDREYGVISGERQVRMEVTRDMAIRGDSYKEFFAKGLDQCRRACEGDRRCEGFNYHTDDGACGLKDQIEKRRHREGVISGEKVNRR